jgi:flagellar protein FliL
MKTMLRLFWLCCLFPVLTLASEGGGEGEAAVDPNKPMISYFSLDPEIITNYITANNEMGYIRIKIEVMVNNAGDLALVQKHEPLIRDTINDVLGQETVERIRSLKGRDLIRQECQDKVNERLLKETGKTIVRELIFTNYLYQ